METARKMWLKNRHKARERGEEIPEAAVALIDGTKEMGIEWDTDAYIARRERTTGAAVRYYRKAL